MDKKRSIELTIISRIEMVLGLLGALFGLLYFVMGWLQNVPLGIGIGILCGVPCLFVLITGELTFRLHPLGRIFHLILSYLIIILVILNLIQGSIKLSTTWLIILILSILLILFFNSAYIKKQFER